MNSTDTHPRPSLVLGSTGKTGQRVARKLQQANMPVRGCARSTPIPFHWDDERTWLPAVRGTEAAYIAYAPDLALPQAAEQIASFAQVARNEGVARLVLLSSRGEPNGVRCEEAVQASGVDWTILRCSWFAQNFTEGAFADSLRHGTLALPVGGIPEPFIDADDIAEVAAAALRGGHAGQVYELTGPRALTFAQAVHEIADATQRPLQYHHISLTDFTGTLARHGTPQHVTDLLAHLFTELLDGRNSATADGVQRALGRPARDFRAFARESAAQGVWAPVLAG
ncbi:NAD(P)H-binding protein [Deinococcus maricopensis]|uniref:dTDP-4-dehydrorhamnose reductase n=1 Tax=Deinococcus maricopensis (strain DSM 21211 / LMG 22137 / NRRL B-23946 / LB-34) TaxID=709986 RepID=E8U448_DEIML|nr:NAD(P)H-binding protein [Deinococcus maricopensis]ADV65885.1 dTDP-4-dehydrorhamnose reductase [Deinococcus maricopensis DSM 21211]